MSALSSALGASWEALAWVSLLLGVAAHLSLQPFEIDSSAWTLLFSYLGVLATLAVSFVTAGGFSLSDSLLRTIIASSAFNVGLASSILLYRAFFHRLRRFPGPFLAKLSRFYAMIKAASRLQANIDIQNLHAEYGDFVRVGMMLLELWLFAYCLRMNTHHYYVGPREISINRPSAIQAIYGHPTRCLRSPWYSQVSNDVSKISINSTRDVELHKLRKRAWERGLAFKGMRGGRGRYLFHLPICPFVLGLTHDAT